MKHKHAELMALYAQDAMETDRPWERWECRYDSGPWRQFGRHPLWSEGTSYRRKHKTTNNAMYEGLKNPFLQGHVEALEDAERKLRAAASAAARCVPEDQIKDVIKWTENYLETLKVRALVYPPNSTNQQNKQQP